MKSTVSQGKLNYELYTICQRPVNFLILVKVEICSLWNRFDAYEKASKI